MDTDLIKGIISLIVAFVPLIIFIFAFIINRTQVTTEANDSTSVRILKLKRNPYNEIKWKNKRRIFDIKCSFLGVVHLVIAVFIYVFFISKTNYIIQLLFILAILLNAFFFFSFFFHSLFHKYHTAKDGRFYLFDSVDLFLAAEYIYLFNKCQNVLKILKFHLVEIDEDEGKIEASKTYFVRGTVTMKIVLEKVEDYKASYKINMSCLYFSRLMVDKEVLKCKIINTVINGIISKPTSDGEKVPSNREAQLETES